MHQVFGNSWLKVERLNDILFRAQKSPSSLGTSRGMNLLSQHADSCAMTGSGWRTACVNCSPQGRQKMPSVLWRAPPIAVSSCSAGLLHHSQILPYGAVSVETGRLNSFMDIETSPCKTK